MSSPTIPAGQGPATTPPPAPEPTQPVHYRTPRQMRAAAAREGVSVPHGAALTDAEARALLDAAHGQRLKRLSSALAADSAALVTIEVHRRDWDYSFREFRVPAHRAARLICHATRLTGATSVRVRVGDGLWFDVPLHLNSLPVA